MAMPYRPKRVPPEVPPTDPKHSTVRDELRFQLEKRSTNHGAVHAVGIAKDTLPAAEI